MGVNVTVRNSIFLCIALITTQSPGEGWNAVWYNAHITADAAIMLMFQVFQNT